MNEKNSTTKGWGVIEGTHTEFWDARPVITGEMATWKDLFKLFFFPKKFLLYRFITKAVKHKSTGAHVRILDVGCGTGASVIEMKKLWGKRVEVVGVDVIAMQIDVARKRVKEYGVWAEFQHYDGKRLPFEDESFDVVYTSDVLGHVRDVPAWLDELYRVLRPGGRLAMFSESKLGKHAWIRNCLLKRGLNIDPHAEFHISLYSKHELRALLYEAGFDIKRMYSTFWAKFFAHPDELYDALQHQKNFPILKFFNKIFFWIKQKTHPFSTAFWELYGLVEMLTVGRWVESQGYIVLGIKYPKAHKIKSP